MLIIKKNFIKTLKNKIKKNKLKQLSTNVSLINNILKSINKKEKN